MKPSVVTVTYGRTFNNGNYESTRIEVTAQVREEMDETPEDVLKSLGKEMTRLRDLDIAIRRHDSGLNVDPKIGRIHK